MSVTFSIRNHNKTYKSPLSSYNPEEPEDPIYNPRFEEVSIYPEINIANSNAAMVLRLLGVDAEASGWAGEFPKEEIPEILKKLRQLDVDTLSHQILHIESYVNRLLHLFHTAETFEESVIWA